MMSDPTEFAGMAAFSTSEAPSLSLNNQKIASATPCREGITRRGDGSRKRSNNRIGNKMPSGRC